jgi:hypothetical protein
MPVLIEFWGMMMREEAIQTAMRRYYRGFYDFLKPIIQFGVDHGEFHVQNVEDVAIAIGALVEGTGILWAADPEMIDLERNIESGIHLLIKGLEKES